MKKKMRVLILLLVLSVLLAGCSKERTAQQTVEEPDTNKCTLTHAVEDHRTVAYRFHATVDSSLDDVGIELVFFDKNVEEFDQADNWCTARIGDTKNDYAFYAERGEDVPEEGAWGQPLFDSPGKWIMFSPYGSLYDLGDDMEQADMVLTFTRSGEQVKAELEVDGAKAWKGEQTVPGLTEETVYLCVYFSNLMLTDVEYQDMGRTRLAPGWLQMLVAVLVFVGSFVLHTFAKRGEDGIYLTEGGAARQTTAFAVSCLAFVVVLFGRGHPDLLSTIFLDTLPIRLAAGGLGFWIPAVLSGVVAVGFVAFWIWLALENLDNPPTYLFGALLFGLCHTLWYGCIAYLILSSIGQIVKLIVSIVFFGIVLIFLMAMVSSPPGNKYREVITTTRVYNSMGSLVDMKSDINYVEIDQDKSKKG